MAGAAVRLAGLGLPVTDRASEFTRREATVLRMAGNIAAGIVMRPDVSPFSSLSIATSAVDIARCIIAEVERTSSPEQKP